MAMRSMSRPVVCPVLVGRTSYLTAFDAMIAATQGGRGQALLIAGEASVGKSRLAAELERGAAARGFTVLQGTCFPPDRTYPYAPVLDILRTGVRPSAANDQLVPDGAMARGLRGLVEEIQPQSGTSATDGVDPEHTKRRHFTTLTRFFLDQATRRPLLVAVEDLHWSD